MTTTIENPTVSRVLAAIEDAKAGAEPEVVAFWDALASLIKTSGDPDEVFDWFFAAIARERGEAAS